MFWKNIVLLSLLVLGCLLAVMPLPVAVVPFWPRWPAVILLCWMIARPQIALGVWAWAIMGLFMDWLLYTPFGQQMLAYGVAGWSGLRAHNGLEFQRFDSMLMQALIVLTTLELCNMFIVWLIGGAVFEFVRSITVGTIITLLLCRSIITTNKR